MQKAFYIYMDLYQVINPFDEFSTKIYQFIKIADQPKEGFDTLELAEYHFQNKLPKPYLNDKTRQYTILPVYKRD